MDPASEQDKLPSAPPDPDAVGLPPGVVLPDAATFKRDQLWSLVVSNAVGLGILLVFWLLYGAKRNFMLFFVVLVGLALLANLLRWASMAAEVRRRAGRSR